MRRSQKQNPIRAVIVIAILLIFSGLASTVSAEPSSGPLLTSGPTESQNTPKTGPALSAAQTYALAVYSNAVYWAHIHDEANRGNRAAVETMIRWRWAGTGQEDRAVRIAYRESNLNPRVTSYTGCCHGIFQLHEDYHGWRFAAMGWPVLWFDAGANIDAAWHLYLEQGWRPWSQTAY